MTGLPLWAYPLASVAACCLLLAGLLWWGERPRGIDLTRLTDDGPSFDEHADQAIALTQDADR